MTHSNTESVRLDQYVTETIGEISRSHAVKLIEQGSVQVNSKLQTKAGYKVKLDDIVAIDFDPAVQQTVPEIDLEVLYEDTDCAVINKPVGVLTHSKGAFNPEPTVATWLAARWQGEPSERGGIVHRLDRATSGVMICAKTPESLSWLQKQFSQRKVKKTYSAVVQGRLSPSAAVIDMPIERNPKKPQTFRVGANGKPAVTEYKTTLGGSTYTLLELRPTTGRTHQLRVHLNHVKHPIVGDVLYGGESADRLYLHAHNLEITLPNRKREIFTVPIPPAFERLVNE